MSSLESVEKMQFEKLFDLKSGYVLSFSNNTFEEFFREHKIDIYSEKYNKDSGSKAKRLRAFWEAEDDKIVGQVLSALLDCWEIENPNPKDDVRITYRKCRDIANRLIENDGTNTPVTEVTRREIFDEIEAMGVSWSGSLPEVDFLSRLFNLDEVPSSDSRFKNAERDILQHRIMNDDWPDYWVFSDSRFNLLRVEDDVFLRFLCEMIHPTLRKEEEARKLLDVFNKYLERDGWMLFRSKEISGRPVFSARLARLKEDLLSTSERVIERLDGEYIDKQIKRMKRALGAEEVDLAVGTAKEFLETICKSILDECSEPYEKSESVLSLVGKVRKKLEVLPESIPDEAKGSKIIKGLLGSLGNIAQGVAEIRNIYGTGHGKPAKSSGLKPRHARLAVGAAMTLGVYLFETFQEKESFVKSEKGI